MSGKFVPSRDVEREELDWGTLGWLSRPPSTGAKQLTVIDVDLLPGKGHDFHKHPDQEEVIFVVNGEIEQWLESSKQILKPGDSVFIPKDSVYACAAARDLACHKFLCEHLRDPDKRHDGRRQRQRLVIPHTPPDGP